MGFFDIIDVLKDVVVSTTEVVNRIVTSQGDISRPMRDIAEAASRLLTLDENIPQDIATQMLAIQEQETGSEQITRLGRKIEYITRRLIEEAKRLTGLKADGQSVVEDIFTGLWVNPVGLTEQNRPSAPIYNAVSVLVSNLNIPPIRSHKGEYRDVVEEVAKVIFEDVTSRKREELIVKRTKTIELDNGASLTVSHAYHVIRLGVPGDQYYIQSAIHIAYRSSNENRIAVAKAKERCNFMTELEREPSWLVTLHVLWATSPTSLNAQDSFQKTLEKKYPKLRIRFSQLVGVYQVLKIQAPLDYTPEAIRAYIQDAAQDNVPVPPSRQDSNQIPLSAQSVIRVLRVNEIPFYLDTDNSRHSSWVDCIAER